MNNYKSSELLNKALGKALEKTVSQYGYGYDEDCEDDSDCPEGESCIDGSCGTGTGACCYGGNLCSDLTGNRCVEVGGDYLGDGVPCDEDGSCPLKTGACCKGEDDCEMTWERSCQGSWRADKSCNEWPQPCDEKCDEPTREATGGSNFDKWLEEQMGCCECLVYAEAGATEGSECMLPIAWVMYNRRNDPNPGGAVCSGDERTPCIQATNNGAFQGGWGGPGVPGAPNGKFKLCFCPEERDPSRSAAAAHACNQLGLNNYSHLIDPSIPPSDFNDPVWSKIGANYYMAPGYVEPEILREVRRGNCRPVTHGVYANCQNKFFRCKRCPR